MKCRTINTSELMKNFSGDEEILQDMIAVVESGLKGLITPIKEAIIDHNPDQLRINAHTLKGVMKNFYAEESGRLSAELEVCGQNSDFQNAAGILEKLESELNAFMLELPLLKAELDKLS